MRSTTDLNIEILNESLRVEVCEGCRNKCYQYSPPSLVPVVSTPGLERTSMFSMMESHEERFQKTGLGPSSSHHPTEELW